MAREKVTVTLSRDKVEAARALTGVRSTSEVIDLALDRLIRAERHAEMALVVVSGADLEDDTDWEALYADGR